MGYRRVNAETLHSIFQRLRAGDSRRSIAAALGLDKKTVNQYVARIEEVVVPHGLGYQETLVLLSSLLSENRKPKPAHTALEPWETEIRSLIGGSKEEHRDPMKAKTAWQVISRRHELDGKTSYETFKRFVRDRGVAAPPWEAVARLESEPGEETQIDYGKMGTRQVETRRRVVYAFCGKLCASRLPYIQYCTSQDAFSFALSFSTMLGFYGGSTKRVNLDNLKSGVITPDIYDPTINRTFAEACEHYGVLVDPARVASPKQKGKVERMVPDARELYKRLDALYPQATLEELNEHARLWCLQEYGGKKHGTTGVPPRHAFEEIEKPLLRPLPDQPFVPATWRTAKVHPDQFIQSGGKYYGLPASYIGKQVEVRITSSLVTIHYHYKVVRTYPVSAKRRMYLREDFPEYAQPFVPGSYASFLCAKAQRLGSQVEGYIRSMLESGGNLALRRAQGCLAVIEKHKADCGLSHVIGQAIALRLHSPEALRRLLEEDATQRLIAFPLSYTGKAMTRSAEYYTGS
jgi:transposase